MAIVIMGLAGLLWSPCFWEDIFFYDQLSQIVGHLDQLYSLIGYLDQLHKYQNIKRISQKVNELYPFGKFLVIFGNFFQNVTLIGKCLYFLLT